jgi:hypothetical protein
MIMMTPHFLSLVPIKIQMQFKNENLAIFTGLFYEYNEQLYLVSNWHNFSGRNPETLQPLAKHGGIPNKAKCRLILKNKLLAWDDYVFNLLGDDGIPLWYHHPNYGHNVDNVDVAVLPISLPDNFKRIHINQYKFSDMRIEVAFPGLCTGRQLSILSFQSGKFSNRHKLPMD